jgi:hypothetical protein
LPWLKEINPRIDWSSGVVDFTDWGVDLITSSDEEVAGYLRYVQAEEAMPKQSGEEDLEPDQLWIQSKLTASQEFAQSHQKEEKLASLPPELAQFKEVFSKKASERFPTSRPWDHAIELKEGFKPKIGKIYPLSIVEQELLDKWLDEQLSKGYIRPSQSPQASPFFFVAKKEKGEF